jgi:predicted Ser/Thr protein kinase
MNRDELRNLLRLRGEALATPTAIIDRALARCARIGVRQTAASGRHAASGSTRSNPTYATTPVSLAAAPTVASRVESPAAATVASKAEASGAVTVPSLAQAPASAQAGAPETGRIIAGYRIEGLLGKGGMGSVYRATQLSMNRPVAFKVLASRFAGDPTFVGRFKREARAAGRLHHPNLVTVHDSGEADGLVFFSMELVEGRSLKEIIKERGRLPPDEALRIAARVLEALAYAHGKGVVHRDIKPDNIMLGAEDSVKVADLGLSRIDERAAGETTELFQTTVGSFMGTPHYMAPEQGRDAHSADHRCDLYALGATLFHLICGQQPFTGSTPMEVLMAAQSKPLVWPEQAPPAAVRELIARLMEKDPARRPADASEALRLVERVLHPPSQQVQIRRSGWRRLRAALLSMVGLAIAAAMILAALHVVSEREADRSWNAALAGAERQADAFQFSKALAGLHQARGTMHDGTLRAVACDEAIAVIAQRWDDWARPNIDATERRFRELLADARYQDALNRLRDVPEAWRSPDCEGRLEALQRAWEEAVAKDAERKRSGGPSESSGIIEQLHEGRRRIAAEMWSHASFAPGAGVQQREGKALFTATGSGKLPLPSPPGPFMPVVLRLAWRGDAAPGKSWELQLDAHTRLVLDGSGAALIGPRGSLPIPRLDEGGYGLPVMQRGGVLAAVLRSKDSEAQFITLPAAGTACAVRWDLGQAEVAVTLGGRR